MPSTIKIKRSANNAAPTTLQFGELALSSNGSTNKLYVGNTSNGVVTLFDSTAGKVDSFQTTLSGLTPSTATTGAVTLSGTLGVTSGGTGSTSAPTPGGVVYGLNSTAIGTTSAGSTGEVLLSGSTGAPTWSNSIVVTSGKVIITSDSSVANRAHLNFGTAGKGSVSPVNGDFWWSSSDNTLKFKPDDIGGTKTLAYSSDIGNGTLTLAVSGVGLSGSATFGANQSTSSTFTVTSNANTANGASTIVARDANGSFSANIITASLSGNATSATTATNIAGGSANQIAYQSASGTTSFVTHPVRLSQILLSGANGSLSSATWEDTTGTGAVVRANTPTLVTPVLGTPSSGTLTNCTGLPISTGVSGLGANIATFLATPSSANLINAVTNETGSGSLVFGTSPTITTSLVTDSASFDLINTIATTVNFARAATSISIGAATGTTTINNDLTVSGNFVVQGNTVTVNTSTLDVEDPLISLGKGNGADTVDLGFYGRYNGTARYAGLFRDASDNKFKLFTGLESEPDTLVNTGGPGYTTATLVATLEGSATSATTATNIAGGSANQITYQSASGTTSFITHPVRLSQILLSGTSGSLSSATWEDTTGSGNIVRANTPTLVTPVLGTPSSGTLTNCTGLPISTGVSGLGANVATFLATPSSANLINAVTNETGSGSLVFGTSPTITTSLVTDSASFDLINTIATTVNFARAATSISIGATTGSTTINNDLVATIDGGTY